MLGRLIFWLVIAALGYGFIRSVQRRIKAQDTSALPATEDMVRCAQCGIHLPRSEGVLSAQKIFCCVEHRDAHPR